MAKVQNINLTKDSTMTKCAQILADAVRRLAPHQGIKKSVRIGRREGRGTSRFITVLVGKPYIRGSGQQGSEYAARAFDIGSGLRGKFRETYPIDPVNGKALYFYSDKLQETVVAQHVDHPGVEGTGYTKAAVKESKPRIREILKVDVKENLRVYLKAEFRNFGK